MSKPEKIAATLILGLILIGLLCLLVFAGYLEWIHVEALQSGREFDAEWGGVGKLLGKAVIAVIALLLVVCVALGWIIWRVWRKPAA